MKTGVSRSTGILPVSRRGILPVSRRGILPVSRRGIPVRGPKDLPMQCTAKTTGEAPVGRRAKMALRLMAKMAMLRFSYTLYEISRPAPSARLRRPRLATRPISKVFTLLVLLPRLAGFFLDESPKCG
jgi:hypothetical protein